ncbi:MAG: decaprenyl-phosphate phosphoribosyltransferase [Chloroflexi bacterium]|nr:decaprenyl-phosphate phosphoribosyltransferase [Chloroflexota bacterium]
MLPSLLKTMRPRQWPKNIFIFAAVAFDHQISLTNPGPFLRTLAGFALLCLISGAVYVMNDLGDIECDRQHPVKRNRPLPSGALPRPVAVFAAVALPVLAAGPGFWLSLGFGLVIAGYFLLNVAYTFWLKNAPIVDVLIIAAGFVLRVGAGVTLITVERFSPWLYVCMTLLALFMGFGKRRAELALLGNNQNTHRESLAGYTLPLLDTYIVIVSASAIMAYSLYTFSAPNLPPNHLMMLTIPFVIYGLFRYLYLIHVRGEGGAPEELLLSDRPLQIAVALWGLAALSILYSG